MATLEHYRVAKDVMDIARESQSKLDYFLLGISVGVLALSARETRPDNELVWLLITSWVLLLLAVLIGIIRQDRLNAASQRLQQTVSNLWIHEWVMNQSFGQNKEPSAEQATLLETTRIKENDARSLTDPLVLGRRLYRWHLTLFFVGLTTFALYRALSIFEP